MWQKMVFVMQSGQIIEVVFQASLITSSSFNTLIFYLKTPLLRIFTYTSTRTVAYRNQCNDEEEKRSNLETSAKMCYLSMEFMTT